MNPFSVITSKIYAGVSVALLIAVAVIGLQLRSAHRTIEKQRNSLATLSAAVNVQNASIRAAGQEADRQRQAFDNAIAAGNETIRAAQTKIVTVRTTQRNGCPTPPQIRGAGL